MDDIVIIGKDKEGIVQLKPYLQHFWTKDFWYLRYFFGIKVAQFKDGLVISQRKYALGILEETRMLNAKLGDTPMDPSVKLVPDKEKPYSNPGRYKRLIGKLDCLTKTHFDITLAVNIVCQFLNSLSRLLGCSHSNPKVLVKFMKIREILKLYDITKW